MKRVVLPFVVATSSFVACSGSSQMAGPTMMGGAASAGAAFVSVFPQGGMSGVSTTTALMFRFGGPMAAGMEQYLDLHLGGLDGPVVPMSCAWSADRTTLTCTPAGPLQPHTTYTIHMGGGLTDASGHPVGYDANGPMMGGQWIMGGMMTGTHGGMGWGMMGNGWHNVNGSYGMEFAFTTA